MRSRTLAMLAAVPLALTGIASGPAQARPAAQAPLAGVQKAAAGFSDGTYIVQLKEPAVASYRGGIAGLAATRPAKGARLDVGSGKVASYRSYLRREQGTVLRSVGGSSALYHYTYTFNGFAADLTADQAAELSKSGDVLRITKQRFYSVDTSSTPDFLGLTDHDGLWDQLGGPENAGKNIVVGIIDSGIWPESLSFSDRTRHGVPSTQGDLEYSRPRNWNGTCVSGEQFSPANCNRKLIGARYFNESFGGDAGINETRPWEFNSPRDYNSHGTHTASTAAGNYRTPTTQDAVALGDSVSGMAPHARVAVYKALWSTESGDTASGSDVDLIAAVDAAVADGVDVINYSISGSQTNFLDPVELAFLSAADAGVFVAASAGNSGPTTSTVAHPSPWITTVAAGTHNRNGSGSVTLGDGTTLSGASVATAVTAPLINATDAGAVGATADQVRLCFSTADGILALDPAKVAGKIVVCDRGVNARTNKSLAVKQAGGVGMILLNTSPNSINADFHYVPTVHLQNTNGPAVRAYAATPGATATINAATITFTDPAPFTASFSSRGPLRAGGGDLLKPDLIAPGQDILAAVSPSLNGRDFDLFSGTSMSSPHVAGLAALLMHRRPEWSPMAIKSALMTSAYDVLDGPATDPTIIFRQGAGHVRPNSAADPGLVYDSTRADWLAFLCGATSGVRPSTCSALQAAGYSTDPSDLNGASIAIGDLAGTQTVTRRVTNVSKHTETFTASVSGLVGVDAVVSPSTLTLTRGQSASFTVSFTRTSAAVNSYVGGYLTWNGSRRHAVRSPIVVRPVSLGAPAAVSGTGGPVSYPVKFGFTGPFTATARGLIPATQITGTVTKDPTGRFSPTGPGVTAHTVTIPDGTTYARFSLFDDFVDGTTDDLDLYVYNAAGTRVGASGNGGSAEEVNLVAPPAGTYTVYVHGFSTDGPDANYTLFTWALGSTDAGNMTVSAPANATLGQTGNVDLTFTGLAPATKYLGSVVYGGSDGMPTTIVRVDTP